MRVPAQGLLDLQGQRVHAATHVRHARGQPPPHIATDRDHRAASAMRTRESAEASTPASPPPPARHSRVRSSSGPRRSTETAPAEPGHPPRSSLEPVRRHPTDRPGRASARQTPGWRSRRDGAPRPKPRRLPQGSPERSDASPPPASDGEPEAPARDGSRETLIIQHRYPPHHQKRGHKESDHFR